MDIERSIEILNATKRTTIKQLAEHLNVTRPWVKKMMKDNNSRSIKEIAGFYQMSVSKFIKVGEQ